MYSPDDSLPHEIQQRNFRHLVFDIGWFGLGIPATARFLSVYAIRLDASAFLLSLMTSLPAITAMLSSMLSGWWRSRYATTVQAQFWPGFGFRLVFLLPALTPFFPDDWQTYWLVIAVTLPAFAQGVSSVTFLVLMREGVGIKALAALTSRRSLVFNSMFGIGTLVFGVGLQEVGFPHNYQLMFIAAFGLSLMSMWHVQQVRTTSTEVRIPAGQPKVRPWQVPSFQRVAFVLITTHVTFFVLAAIIPLRLVDELAAGEEFMSYFGVAELAAAATMAFMAHRILSKLGNLRTMSLAMIGTALAALILGLTSNLNVTLFASALSGGTWVLVSLAAFNFFSEHTPPESLTSYSTLFNQIVSLSIFVGPMIGSQLDGVGLELTTILFIGAALRALAAGLTLINPFERVRRPVSGA